MNQRELFWRVPNPGPVTDRIVEEIEKKQPNWAKLRKEKLKALVKTVYNQMDPPLRNTDLQEAIKLVLQYKGRLDRYFNKIRALNKKYPSKF